VTIRQELVEWLLTVADCRVRASDPSWLESVGAKLGDAALGANDEGEGKGIPVAVVEGLPGAVVVAADVGAVGAGGDPELEGFAALDGGAVFMLGDGPVAASSFCVIERAQG